MRKFLALLVVAALLAVPFVPNIVFASSSEKETPKSEGKEGKDAKKGEEAGDVVADGSVYVHLPPFILPVVTHNGAEQLVTVKADLKVTDLEVATSVRAQMPRVQDSLMQELYGGLGSGELRNGSLVDVGKLKARIAKAVRRVVDSKDINEVLIQAIAQRQL